MTEFRGGTLQERQQGTLRDHENNTASLLREIDIDRRSTLKDARYGTTSTYMSEHQSGTVFIRVSVPELKVQVVVLFLSTFSEIYQSVLVKNFIVYIICHSVSYSLPKPETAD